MLNPLGYKSEQAAEMDISLDLTLTLTLIMYS